MSKKLTIGMILSGIAVIGFLAWAISAVVSVTNNPTNPNVLAEVTGQGAQVIVEEAIPTLFSVILGIVTIFGVTIFAAILIMIAVVGWDRIENFNIFPFVEDIVDYFSDGRASL